MSFINTNSPQALKNDGLKGYVKRSTLILPPLKGSSKQMSIRPESPRTKEAIQELGIDPNQFTIKQLEDFGKDGCSEDIQELRYEHYLERLQQDIKDVQERRMQIIKLNRQRMMNLPPELSSSLENANARKSIIGQNNAGAGSDQNQRRSMMNIPQQNQSINMTKSMSESRMQFKFKTSPLYQTKFNDI